MKAFSFYHRETGAVHPQRFRTDAGEHTLKATLAANTPADHVAIEGALDRESQRVDLTGEKPVIVDYQPPAPSADYDWDAAVRRWKLLPEIAARQEARRAALAAIRQLEESQPRAVREAVLGQAGAADRLRTINEQIAALRAQLTY